MKKSIISLAALAAAALATPAAAQQPSYADDRAQIVNLSNAYMVAVDAGDVETVMDAWADDGVLDWYRGVVHGKEAIHAAMGNFGGAGANLPADATERRRMRHQIINHVIDVDGDTAKSFAYWFAMGNNTSHGQVGLVFMGHYEDELARINGEWKFKKRTVYNESLPNKALFYPGLGESDPRRAN